jgi:hypothetical protein
MARIRTLLASPSSDLDVIERVSRVAQDNGHVADKKARSDVHCKSGVWTIKKAPAKKVAKKAITKIDPGALVVKWRKGK